MTIKEAFQKLTMVCGAALKNPFFVQRNLHDAFAEISDEIVDGGGSTVSVTAELTEGTKIATVTVDGEDTDLYAPEASSGIDYSTDEQDTGIKWIDGKALYQKTIVIRENSVDKFTYDNNTSIYANCIPSGCDYIIVKDFFAKRTGAQFVDYTNCSTDMNSVLYVGGNGLYFKHAVGITYTDIIITILYTKSTT